MHNEIEWFIISWSLPVIHIDHVDKEKEEKRKKQTNWKGFNIVILA